MAELGLDKWMSISSLRVAERLLEELRAGTTDGDLEGAVLELATRADTFAIGKARVLVAALQTDLEVET